jgi:hypothetical protein
MEGRTVNKREREREIKIKFKKTRGCLLVPLLLPLAAAPLLLLIP